MRKRTATIAATAAVVVLAAAACTESTSTADKREREQTDNLQEGYVLSQPIPTADWSQQRQTLIEIQRMQIETTPTWTYFFAVGRADAAPVGSCPSIGDPIPSTYQLTNPVKPVGDIGNNGGGVTIEQMESTGVFTGDSDATNVLCLTAEGKAYKVYWEGQVFSSTLEHVWDGRQLVAKAGAQPTFEFTQKR
jgi:hypothetical protein